MPDTEIIDIEHIAPLEADTIPDVNQSHFCFSCEQAIVGLYCAGCGQKNDDFRRSIFSLIKEFMSSITAIEGRIWRTWGALLFKPGKVAREFADGKRTKWSSPVRVYLAMSIILFGYITLSQTQILSADVNVKIKDSAPKDVSEIMPPDLILSGSLNMFETQKQIDKRNADRDFSLINILIEHGGKYSLDLTEGGLTFEDKINSGQSENITGTDIENLEKTEGSISGADAQTNALKGLLDGWNSVKSDEAEPELQEAESQETEPGGGYLIIGGQNVDPGRGQQALSNFIRNPTRFNEVFSRYLPRVMFIVMPFTMFLGIIFIRGRGNALLYDHLVHSAYIHAVAFFLLFLGLVLGRIPWMPDGWLMLIIFLYLALYLPVSLKTMFKRGAIKTVWTAYSIGFIYLITMLMILLALVVFGMRNMIGPV